ncbi:SKP1-like protein 13, partial [Linum grandiflorum]
ETINHLIEDIGTDDTIPLQNITGPILSKVIEYCRCGTPRPPPPSDDDLKKWDKEFAKVR